MIPNYDQEIEKRHHPENFEPVDQCDQCQFESCDECAFYLSQVKPQRDLGPGCIECGERSRPIIGQCEKCGGAIRECCPDHQSKC